MIEASTVTFFISIIQMFPSLSSPTMSGIPCLVPPLIWRFKRKMSSRISGVAKISRSNSSSVRNGVSTSRVVASFDFQKRFAILLCLVLEVFDSDSHCTVDPRLERFFNETLRARAAIRQLKPAQHVHHQMNFAPPAHHYVIGTHQLARVW